MASLLQIAAETDVVSASPADQLAEQIPESHPNLFLAEWLTHILIESMSAYEAQFPKDMEEKIFYRLLQSWIGSDPGLTTYWSRNSSRLDCFI